MPKPKQFLKGEKKKSKHAAPVPTTADEFLEVGVEHEEAGEKWRGGDAAKSTRFFTRALDAYEGGLKKFPDSFDLAYNKARLQYEMTQHPKILPQLPGTLLELLKTAIESSRYALKLDSENSDALLPQARPPDIFRQTLHSTRSTFYRLFNHLQLLSFATTTSMDDPPHPNSCSKCMSIQKQLAPREKVAFERHPNPCFRCPSIKQRYPFLKLLATHWEPYALLSTQTKYTCCVDVVGSKETCAYTLSNTAQALCSYAEVAKDDDLPSRYLEEALWLFELCLNNQLRAFDKDTAAAKAAAEGNNDVEMADNDDTIPYDSPRAEPSSQIPPPPSQFQPSSAMLASSASSSTSLASNTQTQPQETAWARIVEPVTISTILDTLSAQLQTLTLLTKEVPPADTAAIQHIVNYYQNPILSTLTHPQYGPLFVEREDDIKLAIANYQCAVADLQYNAEEIDLRKYDHIVSNAYDFDMSNSPEALCDAGESFLQFHAAVAHLGMHCEPYLTQRWVVLGKAQNHFTAAWKLPDAQHKEKINALRGDVDMLRFQLGLVGHKDAKKNGAVLLKNAGIFYNGAKITAERDGVREVAVEAEVKSLIVKAFGGDVSELKNVELAQEVSKKVIVEAVADGVVTSAQLAEFGINGY